MDFFLAQPPYRMVQGLMGLKDGYRKSHEKKWWPKRPNNDEIARGF
jgi:hypothetical protein